MNAMEKSNVKMSQSIFEMLKECMEYESSFPFHGRLSQGDFLYELLCLVDFEGLDSIPLEVIKVNESAKKEKKQLGANVKLRDKLREIKELTGLSHSLILAYAIYSARLIKEKLSDSILSLGDIAHCNRGILTGWTGEGKSYLGIKPLYENGQNVVLLAPKNEVSYLSLQEDETHKIFYPSGGDELECFFSQEDLKEVEKYIEEHDTKLFLIDETFQCLSDLLGLDFLLSFLEGKNIRIFFTTNPCVHSELISFFLDLIWNRGYEEVYVGQAEKRKPFEYKTSILQFLSCKKGTKAKRCEVEKQND